MSESQGTDRGKRARTRASDLYGVAIKVRLSHELVARLDAWAGAKTARSAAIRLAVEFTLAAGMPLEKLQHVPGLVKPKGKPGRPGVAKALIVRVLNGQKEGITVPEILAAATGPDERKLSIHAVRRELCLGKKAHRYASHKGKWKLVSGNS